MIPKLVLVLSFLVGLRAINFAEEYRKAIEKYDPQVQDSGRLSSSSLLRDKTHFRNFKRKAKKALAHNKDKSRTWDAAINEFTLKTDEEFQQYLGLNASKKEENDDVIIVKRDEGDSDEVPDEVNYEDKIPPVKNQGGCGSCWAFGAMTPLEYQVNKDRDTKNKGVISLSEQQCLDCTSPNGCGGGWPTTCYNWAKFYRNHYVATGNYPYEASSGRPCRYAEHKSAMSGFKIVGNGYPSRAKGYRDHDTTLLLANRKAGVLFAAISVSGSFGSYGKGVFQAKDCNNGINHAVVIVGYGNKDGLNYFKVRNSWGSGWGDGGYIRMLRGIGDEYHNMCRLTQFVSYPVLTGNDDGKSDIGVPPSRKPLECSDGRQASYRGKKNTTKSGLPCQKWSSQTPHSHTRTPERNPNAGLVDNFCRNPDGEPKAWCYTTDNNTRFEMCDVKSCEQELWCTMKDKTLVGELGNETFANISDAKRACYHNVHCTGIVKNAGMSMYWLSNGPYVIEEEGTVTERKGRCKLEGTEPLAKSDEWCFMDNTYLSSFTPGSWRVKDFELAKFYCEGVSDCGGVLQRPSDGEFELRVGPDPKRSRSGEKVWLKGECPPTEPPVTDSDYCEMKNRYIPAYTSGGRKASTSLEEAKKLCTEFQGSGGCFGLTYEPGAKEYTLRRYTFTLPSPSNEISYVKNKRC